MELTLGEKIIRVENNYRNVESSALKQLLIAKNNDLVVKYGRQVSREYDLKLPVLAQCIYAGDKITAAIEKRNILFYRKQHGLSSNDVMIDEVDKLPSKQELIISFNKFQANQFDFAAQTYSNHSDKKDQNLGIAYKNMGKWSLKSIEVEKELKPLLSTSNEELPNLNNMLKLNGLHTGFVDTLIKCHSNDTTVIRKEEMCYISSHFKHSTNVFEVVQGTYVSSNIDALVTTLSKQGGNSSAELDTCALLKAFTIDNKIHVRPLCNISDILLAAEELFESNSPFSDGCITMPKVLPKYFKRAVGSYFRYHYILNKPGQWFHIQINLPKGLVYSTTIRQLTCPLLFSTEYMDINPVSSLDIDAKLIESCNEIVQTMRNSYNNDMLLSEMRLDFEPCHVSSKVSRTENKCHYRLFHMSHFKYLERITSTRRNAVEGVHSLIKERLRLFAKIFKKEKNRVLEVKNNLRSVPGIDVTEATDIESIHLHSIAKNMAVNLVENKQCDYKVNFDEYDSDDADINDIYDDGLHEYPSESHAVVQIPSAIESYATNIHVDPKLIEIAKKKYYKKIESDVSEDAATASAGLNCHSSTPITRPASRHHRSHVTKTATSYGLITPVDVNNTAVITVDKFLKIWDDICEQEYAYSRELDAIMHSTKYAGADELNDIVYEVAANNPLDSLFEDAPTIAQDIRARLREKYNHLVDESEDDNRRLEFNQTCNQTLYSILQGLNINDVGWIMNKLNKPKNRKKKTKHVEAKDIVEKVTKPTEKKSRIVKRAKKDVLTTNDVAVILEEIEKPKIVRKYVEVPVYVRKERQVPVINEEERSLLFHRRMQVEAELLAMKAARAERLKQFMLKALMTRYMQCMHLPKVTLDGNLLEEEKLLQELRLIGLERSKKIYCVNKESKNSSIQVGGSLWNNESKPMLVDDGHNSHPSARKRTNANIIEVFASTFATDVVSRGAKSVYLKHAAKMESIALVNTIIDNVTEYIGTIATVSDNEYIIISEPMDLIILKISQEANTLATNTICKVQEEVSRIDTQGSYQLMESNTSLGCSSIDLIEEEECFEPFDDEDDDEDTVTDLSQSLFDSRNNGIIQLMNFNVNISPKSSISISLPDESVYSECIYIPNLNLGDVKDNDLIAGSSILGPDGDTANHIPEDMIHTIAQSFVVKLIYECLCRDLEAVSTSANTISPRQNGNSNATRNDKAIIISATNSMSANNLSIVAASIPTPATERRRPHRPIESRQIIMAGVYNEEEKRRLNLKSNGAHSEATTNQYLSFLDPIFTENGVPTGVWMPSLSTFNSQTVEAIEPTNDILDEFKPPVQSSFVPHRPVARVHKESKVNNAAWKRKSTKAMKVLTENIKKVSSTHCAKGSNTVEDPFLYSTDDRYGVVNSIPNNNKLAPTSTRIVPPTLSKIKSEIKDKAFTLSMIEYYMAEQRRLFDAPVRSVNTPDVASGKQILSSNPEFISTPGYDKIWTTKPVYNVIRPAAKTRESLPLHEEINEAIELAKENITCIVNPIDNTSVDYNAAEIITSNNHADTSTVVNSISKYEGDESELSRLLTVDKIKIGFGVTNVANAQAIMAKETTEAPEILNYQYSSDVLHPRPPTVSHSSKPKSPRVESKQLVLDVPKDIEPLVVGKASQVSAKRLQSQLLPRIGNKSPSNYAKLTNRILNEKPQIDRHMQAEGHKVLQETPVNKDYHELKIEQDELLSYQVSVQELFDSYFRQKYGQNKYDTDRRRNDSFGERTYIITDTAYAALENLSRDEGRAIVEQCRNNI